MPHPKGPLPLLLEMLVEITAVENPRKAVHQGKLFQQIGADLQVHLVPHPGSHHCGVKGLYDIICRTKIKPKLLFVRPAFGGDEDHRDPIGGTLGFQASADLVSIHAGHLDIQQNKIRRRLSANYFQSLFSAQSYKNAILPLEQACQSPNIGGGIIHDQYGTDVVITHARPSSPSGKKDSRSSRASSISKECMRSSSFDRVPSNPRERSTPPAF